MDSFVPEPVSEYYPLKVGNYITYNLDSTIFIKFGQKDTVIRYQVQDRIDAQITDNSGRPAFRILRFIRRNASEEWTPNNTFSVVQASKAIEYVENNFRFVKLATPFKQDYSWKGNTFIDTYSVSNDARYLDDWDYTYDSVGMPLTINGVKFDSTIKVAQRDEFLGQSPSIPGTQYAEKTFAVEKYAKGVGLIYREFLHWEYQGSQNGSPGYYNGYGIKMSIIDHN